MLIKNTEDLKRVIASKQTDFEVSEAAFDFCDQIRMEQIVGSGADWSIAVTHGWMALITALNHKIHRAFMSQEKRDLQDLKHVISRQYIIRKLDDKTKYKLILRK